MCIKTCTNIISDCYWRCVCCWCTIYLLLFYLLYLTVIGLFTCKTKRLGTGTHWKLCYLICVYPVRATKPMRTSECFSWITLRCAAARRGVFVGGPTCLEWPRESGCLKKESGSFLILMGRDGGCRLALLGFITALKRASSSVCESPRTCTICCPAGGAPWCASMSPKFGVTAKKLNSTHRTGRTKQKSRGALEVDAGALQF